MLKNIIVIAVNLADNIMLGSYSETALSGAAAAAILFFVRIPVLGMYTLSDETRRMANTFLIMECLISIWGIVFPLSIIMAFVVKASPEVVFFCLSADQLFKCVPVWIKVNHGKWIRNLTRDNTAYEVQETR